MHHRPARSTLFPYTTLFRSLDFWLIGDGAPLLPSKCASAEQTLDVGENILVRTRVADEPRAIASDVWMEQDRKSTRLNSSHSQISYAVFCLKKKRSTAHVLW